MAPFRSCQVETDAYSAPVDLATIGAGQRSNVSLLNTKGEANIWVQPLSRTWVTINIPIEIRRPNDRDLDMQRAAMRLANVCKVRYHGRRGSP